MSARAARRAGEAGLAERVIAWQRRHGRHDLPWQGTRDPYRVWLSEVMLQQTQVSTVLDYYPRFVERFADVATLAAAPLDDVLALWSGLGYYRRARLLHACAQAVVREHEGQFPGTAAQLATLPGIGRSTAAAIAAFCFGERAAILDGNVKRVLARALGVADDLGTAAGERTMWARAEALLPASGIETYTQGLMDLGATLCSVRQPRCVACPLTSDCVARAQDRMADYPRKTRRLKRGRRAHALLLLALGGQLWLTQRPPQGVWAGLWSLPEYEDVEALLRAAQGWPGGHELLPEFEHVLTHFDWALSPVRWALPARTAAARLAAIEAVLPPGRWVTREQALAMGLPAPVRRLLGAG